MDLSALVTLGVRCCWPCARMAGCSILLLTAAAAFSALAPAPVSDGVLELSLRAPESDSDKRGEYPGAALRLALDKTLASHGPYRLQAAPPMNKRRTIKTLSDRSLPNFLAVLAFESEHAKLGLDYVRFPLHFGAIGYRVCFVAPAKREAVAKAKTLAELKQFTFGQGAGWTDVAVLRSNGFKVVEVAAYESLFAMLNRGRFDLLCRGVTEIEQERHAHPETTLDESFALVYALPMFFYTHQENLEAKQRVAAGLQIAFDDGTLLKLFDRHFLAGMKMLDLSKRRVHRLDNPAVDAVDFDLRKYELRSFGVRDRGVDP